MSDGSSSFPFRVVAAGLSDIGRRRHNEDSLLLRPDLNLFIVADGAGGHEAGNVASALACTSVAHYFEQTAKSYEQAPEVDSIGLPTAVRRLSVALHRANREVLEIAKATNRHKGMGTTIAVAWLDARRNQLHVGHVGDSRCYRLRGRFLEALTQDHALVIELLEMKPEMDDAALSRLPRNVVTRALGMGPDVRTTLRSYEVAPGDKYLLCTDGLHGALDDAQIAEALAIERSPEEQARLLIEMAKEAGSRDNIAAVIIECDPIPNLRLRQRPLSERPRMPPPSDDDTMPEIVVLEQHEGAGELAVVPADSGSPSMRDALQGFISPSSTQRAIKSPLMIPRPPKTPRSDK